ncbi:hypothetical protein [Cellulomonas sp. Marseille-Q8402]
MLLITVLAVAGCAAWFAHGRWDARAEKALTEAHATLDRAVVDLGAARDDGRVVLAQSAGRVEDNAVRQDLAALLVGLPPTTTDDAASRGDRTAQARDRAGALHERTTAVTAATSEVRTAQAAWELDRAVEAHADAVAVLGVAVETATGVLAGSEGRVPDDTVRGALAAAIDAAAAVRDAAAPTGVDALTASAAEAEEVADALGRAQAAVAEAEAAWQAEQDRVAAEQAAAAGRRTASGTVAGAGRAAGATRGSSGSSGRESGGGSSSGGTDWFRTWQPGDPVPDGYDVVVDSQGGGWGGDEFGNVWEH